MSLFSGTSMRSQQEGALSTLLSNKPASNISSADVGSYFDKSLAAPAYGAWERYVKPQIEDQYSLRGGTLTSRLGTEKAQSLDQLTSQLVAQQAATSQAALFQNAQSQEMATNRLATGFGLADLYRQAPLLEASMMQQAASPYQQYAQNLATEGYQKWTTSQPFGNPYINPLSQLLSLGGGAQYMASSGGGGFDPMGMIAGGIGGGMLGTSLGGMFGGGAGAAGGTLASGLGGALAADLGAVGGGAVAGAAAGSIVPGIGTIIGALLGAGLFAS